MLFALREFTPESVWNEKMLKFSSVPEYWFGGEAAVWADSEWFLPAYPVDQLRNLVCTG
jgi:hypothetical protein